MGCCADTVEPSPASVHVLVIRLKVGPTCCCIEVRRYVPEGIAGHEGRIRRAIVPRDSQPLNGRSTSWEESVACGELLHRMSSVAVSPLVRRIRAA
jgi:hypothetical protein